VEPARGARATGRRSCARQLDAVALAAVDAAQRHRERVRGGVDRAEALQAVPRRQVRLAGGGRPLERDLGAERRIEALGPNVPAWIGPATNSQNGSNRAPVARAGS